MRYNVQSANVLNEADRFQAILDWQLFSMEQDARLHDSPVEDDWRPGEPLHQDPRWILREEQGCHCADCVENLETPRENYDGNTVRPMIQEFVDGNGALDPVCPNCEVWWSVKRDPICFICGKDFTFLLPGKPEPLYDAASLWHHNYDEPIGNIFTDSEGELRRYITAELTREVGIDWREMMQRQLETYTASMNAAIREVSEAARRVSGAMRGMRAHFVVLNEAQDFDGDTWWRGIGLTSSG